MSFNLFEVTSQIANRGGLLRTNKFKITLPVPPAMRNTSISNIQDFIATQRDLEFWCEAANIPGIALDTAEINRYGYGPNEKKPWRPVFTDFNCTFRGDGNGDIWNYLRTWLQIPLCYISSGPNGDGNLNSPIGVVQDQHPYEVAYKETYMVDANLEVYNDMGDLNTSLVLRQCYPIFVGDTPLNWGERDEYQRIPVTFTYFDWYSLGPAAIAAPSTGNSASTPSAG